MSRYNRCGDCYNMECVFVTGERTDFDTSECLNFRPMTNADRIRAMTDEELAEWMETSVTCASCPVDLDACRNKLSGEISCEEILLDWLKQEVEE